MTKANGFQVWSGSSQINGAPIKAVLTATQRASANPKTADMLQLWIMPANVKPGEAVKTGEDEAVCGNCPARPINAKKAGITPCYVNTHQAPGAVYKTEYPMERDYGTRNAPIRLGAWGDPAALPFETVRGLLIGQDNHTGYTHQWKTCDPRFKTLLMASVDTEAEAIEAQNAGWRTFRVIRGDDSARMNHEIQCPASNEAGKRTTCADCRLCRGTSNNAKSIVIMAH